MRTPWNLMTSSAAIKSASKNTVTGAITYTTITGLDSVECNVQPDTSTDALQYQRETGKRRSTIHLPMRLGDGTSVEVLKEYQIVVSGRTYRVVGAGMNAAGQGANQVVNVEEDS